MLSIVEYAKNILYDDPEEWVALQIKKVCDAGPGPKRKERIKNPHRLKWLMCYSEARYMAAEQILQGLHDLLEVAENSRSKSNRIY